MPPDERINHHHERGTKTSLASAVHARGSRRDSAVPCSTAQSVGGHQKVAFFTIAAALCAMMRLWILDNSEALEAEAASLDDDSLYTGRNYRTVSSSSKSTSLNDDEKEAA